MRKIQTKLNLSLIVAVFLILAFNLTAEFKNLPDQNTLWIETCKNVLLGPPENTDAWRNNQVEIKDSIDGLHIRGFNPADDRVSTGRWVPIDPAYPYIVMEISKVEHDEGYRGMIFWLLEHTAPPASFSTNIQTGVYVWPAFTKLHPIKQGANSDFLRIDIYNAQILLKYIKMVKDPEFNVEILPLDSSKQEIKVGEELLIRVTLPEKVEDVTVALSNTDPSQRIIFNGMATIQLKPSKENPKVWQANFKLTKIEGTGETIIQPGKLLLRAIPLGGENLPKSIWSINTLPIKQ